ncbi:MAG: glycosyltransferase [Clostridia bacterium]|nr:glycosyltransferase [Clostridia bacterium]
MCRQFSVALAIYEKDDPAFFDAAMDSILHQTVPPSEVIVVVDGPIPSALNEALLVYEPSPTVRVIRLPENRGHGEARRAGLACCNYDLVALMDADDISAPDRFEKQLSYMEEHPDVSVVGGQIAEFVGDLDNVVGLREVYPTDEEIKKDLKQRCPLNQVTVLFRRADVEAVGGYLDFFCEEDYYLWVRMYLAGMRFANLPDVLVYVRVGEDMYRRRGGIRYFKSEARLQKIMYKEGIISFTRYLVNVAKRLAVQVLLPNRLRSFVFRHFARKSAPAKKEN